MGTVRYVLFLLFMTGPAAEAATGVEMEACESTPEVKKELRLTPEQERNFDKVFADLAPARNLIHEAKQRREQMIKNGVRKDEIADQTRKIIQMEAQCRTLGNQRLKPILNEEQYKLALEMQELHRRRVSGRPTPPPSTEP